VFVATRPLLLSILKERLERLGQPEDDWQSFLAPTKALISTGIKSATKTLHILTDENSLLGKTVVLLAAGEGIELISRS
jgi:proline utilization trans-activator